MKKLFTEINGRTVELCTERGYAIHCGVDRNAIRSRFESGSLDKSVMYWHPEKHRSYYVKEFADEMFAIRGSKQHIMSGNIGAGKKPPVDLTPEKQDQGPIVPDQNAVEHIDMDDVEKIVTAAGTSGQRYQDAKANSEMLKVKKLQMELDEKDGRLIDVESVRTTLVKLVGETREVLLNIPPKIAADILSCETVFEVEQMLQKEIYQALESLSRSELTNEAK